MPERIGERGPVDHIVCKGLAAAFRELGLALVIAHRFLLNLTTAITVVDRAYEPSNPRAVRQEQGDRHNPHSAHDLLLLMFGMRSLG